MPATVEGAARGPCVVNTASTILGLGLLTRRLEEKEGWRLWRGGGEMYHG